MAGRRRVGLLLPPLLAGAAALSAQQRSDTVWRAALDRPRFPPAAGPVVAIDEGHQNFHTLSGRFRPFGRLLAQDGYRVRARRGPFTAARLAGIDVLVIANALHPSSREAWRAPTPSAFTDREVAAVAAWVERGGGLLLAADHMPFPGAAAPLASRFGLHFTNGFALGPDRGDLPAFSRAAGTLLAHPVTDGASPADWIDSVRSFTGQAFAVPATFAPLLLLPTGAVNWLPAEAWVFDSATPRHPAAGMAQAAAGRIGQGRVVVVGEAAMLTAQSAGGRAVGMNAPAAPQNWRFVRNLVAWLAGDRDGPSRR